MKQQKQCVETSESEEVSTVRGRRPEHDTERLFFTPAVAVGRLAAVGPGSTPLVDYPGNDSGKLIPARTLVELNASQTGTELALAFEDGDGNRPIILGIIQSRDALLADSAASVSEGVEIRREQGSLIMTADKEITLRCGKTSITLTRAGKLLLQGAYLLSRSLGVNRIKGGSVQIN
jgi:hypothetical protein